MPAGRPKLKPRTFTDEEKKELLNKADERWEEFKKDKAASDNFTQQCIDRVVKRIKRKRLNFN